MDILFTEWPKQSSERAETDTEPPEQKTEGLLSGTDAAPLREIDGVLRVGGTRVTLDSVVAALRDGETAEGITHRYPTLDLDDVYSVLSWYLHHRDSVSNYLAWRKNEAERFQEEMEARFEPTGVRERLLSRRRPRGNEPGDPRGG